MLPTESTRFAPPADWPAYILPWQLDFANPGPSEVDQSDCSGIGEFLRRTWHGLADWCAVCEFAHNGLRRLEVAHGRATGGSVAEFPDPLFQYWQSELLNVSVQLNNDVFNFVEASPYDLISADIVPGHLRKDNISTSDWQFIQSYCHAHVSAECRRQTAYDVFNNAAVSVLGSRAEFEIDESDFLEEAESAARRVVLSRILKTPFRILAVSDLLEWLGFLRDADVESDLFELGYPGLGYRNSQPVLQDSDLIELAIPGLRAGHAFASCCGFNALGWTESDPHWSDADACWDPNNVDCRNRFASDVDADYWGQRCGDVMRRSVRTSRGFLAERQSVLNAVAAKTLRMVDSLGGSTGDIQIPGFCEWDQLLNFIVPIVLNATSQSLISEPTSPGWSGSESLERTADAQAEVPSAAQTKTSEITLAVKQPDAQTRAIQYLLENSFPRPTKCEIARQVGCDTKSLSEKRASRFHALWKAYGQGADVPRGYRGNNGHLEAVDHR